MPSARGDARPRRISHCPARNPPITTPVTTAASGRYIRFSAPTCWSKGMKLELGARIAKNHTPSKPSHGR